LNPFFHCREREGRHGEPGGSGRGWGELELRESSCHKVGDAGHCPNVLDGTGGIWIVMSFLSLRGGHSDTDAYADYVASAPRGISTSTRRRRQHNASGDGDWDRDGDGEEQASHGGSPGPAAAWALSSASAVEEKQGQNGHAGMVGR